MSALKQKHFYVFGYLINQHASIQRGFILYLEKLVGISRFAANIMTEPYRSLDYYDVMVALVNHFESDGDRKAAILDVLKRWDNERPLRNKLAHQGLWVSGQAEDSIKPFGMTIRGGNVKLFGDAENETEITFEELEAACVRLDEVKGALVKLIGDPDASEPS